MTEQEFIEKIKRELAIIRLDPELSKLLKKERGD
jgi:hypothetical protein